MAAARRLVGPGIGGRSGCGHAPDVGAPGSADGGPGRAPDGVLQRARLGRLHVVQALDVVLLRRPVAAPLLGQDVDDDRPVPLGGVGEGLLHQVDVVTVDRAGVAHTERFEEGVRGHHFAQAAGDRMRAGIGQRTERGETAETVAQPFAVWV